MFFEEQLLDKSSPIDNKCEKLDVISDFYSNKNNKAAFCCWQA